MKPLPVAEAGHRQIGVRRLELGIDLFVDRRSTSRIQSMSSADIVLLTSDLLTCHLTVSASR